MDDNFDPYLIFPEFYHNPLFQRIKDTPKWTISDKNKRPIDMRALKDRGEIRGAEHTNENSLMTLPELCEFLPNAANHAFYLDALTDGFVVLDVEPKCPEEIKRKMLSLPYLYGEVSMSGKGLHLVFLLPECIKDYPIAQKKVVLKEANGFYEILLNHYVTFTRRAICPYYNLPDQTNKNAFVELFQQMASQQVEVHRDDFHVDEIAPDSIPNQGYILNMLENKSYQKTPNDFANDMSKYEYAHIGYLYYNLKRVLNWKSLRDHDYTEQEKAWLLYYAAKNQIPYRAKHKERRYGLPWLLYLSQEVIAKSDR